MITYAVYCHTCVVTGKSYVGYTEKTVLKRWHWHLKDARQNRYHFHRAIRKYGTHSWRHTTLEICDSKKGAQQREIYWIAKLKASDHEFGYNSTLGGEGVTPNQETRRRLSESHMGQTPWNKGKTMSPEICLALSRAHLGKAAPWNKRPLTDQEKKNLREKCSGRKHTPEEIRKQIEAQTGRRHSEETKQKLRRPRTEEQRQRMKVAQQARRKREGHPCL